MTARSARGAAAWVEDVALVLLLGLAAPVLILLVGAPIALGVRAAIEILGRL